jgi:CPA2 family monovalent cation:H+ antiporter-2
VALAVHFTGSSWGTAVFFGSLAALSSTAVVLRLLGEQAKLESPAGRVSLGILLFQDLAIVPLMLLVPFLAGKGAGVSSLLITLGKAGAVVVGVVIVARLIVPPVLARVVKTRSRELFLTLLLVLCLGTAFLTSLAGLSLALGAFLAGLAISESEYSHQAMAEAMPFRDAFGSLFFVSIGMLMDVRFVFANLPVVALVVVAIVVLKTVTTGLSVAIIGYPLSVAVNVGLTLAQVGEFAFVLSKSGLRENLISAREYQLFLSASVVTLVITPALISLGRRLSDRLPQHRMAAESAPPKHELDEHVVVAGYGVNGQNLSRALAGAKIPYAILEMNPETVRAARERGEPIHYGDCTRIAVLDSVSISQARMFVVAISDAASTRQAVSIARTTNPNLYILARTRFVAEVDELRRLGANEVIPEEFETSLEIFARALHQFNVPRNVVLEKIAAIRRGAYGMLRGETGASASALPLASALEGAEVDTLYVKQTSPAIGRTLADLELRQKTGAGVIAVKRAETSQPNPGGDFVIEAGDTLVVLGDRDALDRALVLIDPDVEVT